jgi:AcrR family transcriptional regulator
MPVPRENKSKVVGRPRSFDEAEALDKAMNVFWQKGFEGASISDLTHAMGIKPASLYGAFGNKQELFHRALERYKSQQLPFLLDVLEEPTAYQVAERLLRESAIFLTRPGLPHRCLTIETLADCDEGRAVQNDLLLLRMEGQEGLRKRFARAKREGDLPKAADPDSLARFITAVCQGMNIQSTNGATRKQLLDLAQTSLRAWPV